MHPVPLPLYRCKISHLVRWVTFSLACHGFADYQMALRKIFSMLRGSKWVSVHDFVAGDNRPLRIAARLVVVVVSVVVIVVVVVVVVGGGGVSIGSVVQGSFDFVLALTVAPAYYHVVVVVEAVGEAVRYHAFAGSDVEGPILVMTLGRFAGVEI